MSKCGVIQRDPRTNKLKIKLYKDAEGNLKGDATCCYIKVQSSFYCLYLTVFKLSGSIFVVYLKLPL